MLTCIHLSSHVNLFMYLAYIFLCMHPLKVAVILYTLLYSTVAVQHEELTKDLMEPEAQRKGKKRQEEEVTEELKSFTTQGMAGGFSLFEESLLVLRHGT